MNNNHTLFERRRAVRLLLPLLVPFPRSYSSTVAGHQTIPPSFLLLLLLPSAARSLGRSVDYLPID